MRSVLAAALITLSLAVPGTAFAAVKAGQPFPSNLFTTADRTQVTGLRVGLSKPDCAVRPSDCADVDVLNTLDGFNIQPRISIPFSGPIDVATVSSETVFLLGRVAGESGSTRSCGSLPRTRFTSRATSNSSSTRDTC